MLVTEHLGLYVQQWSARRAHHSLRMHTNSVQADLSINTTINKIMHSMYVLLLKPALSYKQGQITALPFCMCVSQPIDD